MIKLHTWVVMNSTIGSTLEPRALDVGSLDYFEAFEIFIAIKNILQIFSQIKKLDNLIQHYPYPSAP